MNFFMIIININALKDGDYMFFSLAEPWKNYQDQAIHVSWIETQIFLFQKLIWLIVVTYLTQGLVLSPDGPRPGSKLNRYATSQGRKRSFSQITRDP